MCGYVSVFLIALLLFQDGFSQLLDDACGGPRQLIFQVRGGRFVDTAPFMAAIYYGTDFLCGGTLIHKRYILSAAHCFTKHNNVTVYLGLIDRLCSETNCPHVQYRNVEIISHPGFQQPGVDNDIALLKLDRDVIYKDFIYPICVILDEEVTSDPINTFSAYGWGRTENETLSRVLKTVTLNRLECPMSNICAGGNSKDTSRGDSGGPLAASTPYRGKARFVQYGVVSFGDPNKSDWGVYTDVNRFKLWIANTVLEPEQRLLTENCKSDWGRNVLVRLWEISLFEHNFSGALITNQFVLTVASAFPKNFKGMKVESKYSYMYDVDWFYLHPEFTAYPSIKNNIAVIKLSRKLPKSDLEAPICMGLNLSPPMTWNAYLYSPDASFLGYRSVDLKRIDNCSAKLKLPVERDQFCIEKPDQLMYSPYETPGSVIGTKQTFEGTERYLIAALISHTQGNVIVLTNIHEHQKWIANVLKI